MNQISIYFENKNKLTKITHYELPYGRKVYFDEVKEQIDLNPLRSYVGADFNEIVNGEFKKKNTILKICDIIDDKGNEVLAIEMAI